jgi:hypothetical protein
MSFINCTAIRRVKQDEFKTFADLVYDNMNGKAVYAPFQEAVMAMKTAAEIFQSALIKSKGRAMEAVDAKDVAKEDLYNALVRIAKSMDALYPTNAQDKLKTDAGFTLNKVPERQNVTFVEPPTNLRAYNDPRRGVIIVEFDKASNAVTTAFEVQQDGGEWQNGLYCEKAKMELTYPFGAKLLLRAKTIGSNQMTSGYTPPVDVMVS